MGKYDKWTFDGHECRDTHAEVLAAASSAPIRLREGGVFTCRDRRLNGATVVDLHTIGWLERGQIEDDLRALTLSPKGADALEHVRAGVRSW